MQVRLAKNAHHETAAAGTSRNRERRGRRKVRCCQATSAHHATDGAAAAARKTLARAKGRPLRMRHPVPRCAARRYRCISSSRSARKQNTPAPSAKERSANAADVNNGVGGQRAAPPLPLPPAGRMPRSGEERDYCSGQEKAKGGLAPASTSHLQAGRYAG